VVRCRPLGAVIAEIYFNLGIPPNHPLWLEVKEAMFEFGGSLAKLLHDILERYCPLKPPLQAAAPQVTSPCEAPSGTGPP
jgi:hypothetical protein